MARDLHRVGSARFHISGPDQAALLHWRTRLDAAGTGALMEAVDAALSGLAAEDEVLVIDRLEVDLGEFEADEFDLAHLGTALRQAVQRAGHAAAPGPATTTVDGMTRAPTARNQPALRIPIPVSAAASLITYLATGRLRTAAPFETLADVYAALKVDQTTADMLHHLLRASAPTALHAALLRLLLTAPTPLAQQLLAMAFPELKATMMETLALVKKHRTDATADPIPAQAQHIADLIARGQAVAKASPTPHKRKDDTPSLDIECKNAGLVLLHPYLRPYFTGLDLMKDNTFTGRDAQATAARLLHFLATGEAEADEPELTIPRLLCALPDDLPSLPMAPLDPAHLAEGARLLEALITAWEGIGHTSPDGLRQTFLQRDGLLSGPPDTPKLTLERRGVDILLDRLPWPVSIMKLPWMPAALKVDWT